MACLAKVDSCPIPLDSCPTKVNDSLSIKRAVRSFFYVLKRLEELLSLDKTTVGIVFQLIKGPRQPSKLVREDLGVSRSRVYGVIGDLVDSGMAVRRKDGSVGLQPDFERFVKGVERVYRKEILHEKIATEHEVPPPPRPRGPKPVRLQRVRDLVPSVSGVLDIFSLFLFLTGLVLVLLVPVRYFMTEGNLFYAIVTFLIIAVPTWVPAAWLHEKAQERARRRKRLREFVRSE